MKKKEKEQTDKPIISPAEICISEQTS